MIKKKISKILVPLDGSKNSQRGLEMAITLARQCGATITGVYSINVQSRPEFRSVGAVTDKMNKEIEKMLKDAKVLAAQMGLFSKKRK